MRGQPNALAGINGGRLGKHTKWLWLGLIAVAVSAVLAVRLRLRGSVSADAGCWELAVKLQQKQASKEQDKIRVYYEFKSTEMPDEEAWRKAVLEVESQIAALSNAVARCQLQQPPSPPSARPAVVPSP